VHTTKEYAELQFLSEQLKFGNGIDFRTVLRNCNGKNGQTHVMIRPARRFAEVYLLPVVHQYM
jgi:hypothetical protein